MEYEDSPPNVPPPKGILSTSETLPTVGLSPMGEQMAPDGEHTDAESVHAETIMEAFKAGDSEALRDGLAAFVRECVRNYNRGKSTE